MSDGVELCLPWDVTDDGDDHVIASVREPVEIARIPYGQGADDVAAFIVRAANEHIGLTRALHRVEGEAQAQRTRAEAAEAEVARLRAIVEGRTTAPTDAEIDAHYRAGGGWIYSRPEGVRASVVAQPMTARTIIYAAACQRETLRWMAVDANSRPTAWPVVEAPAPDLCECGHPVEMHRGADRCGAHGCGCDRNAEEASWR